MDNRLLKQLIAQHKRVVVPEFGAFLKKEGPGGEQLVFSPFLRRDDGVAVEAVVREYGVDRQDAQAMIEEFVRYLRQSLASSGRYQIEGVGMLMTDANGVVALKEGVQDRVQVQPQQPQVVEAKPIQPVQPRPIIQPQSQITPQPVPQQSVPAQPMPQPQPVPPRPQVIHQGVGYQGQPIPQQPQPQPAANRAQPVQPQQPQRPMPQPVQPAQPVQQPFQSYPGQLPGQPPRQRYSQHPQHPQQGRPMGAPQQGRPMGQPQQQPQPPQPQQQPQSVYPGRPSMAMIPLGQPFPPQGHIQGGPNSRPGGRPGPRRGKQPRRRKAAPGYHPHGAGKRSKMDFWLILVIIVALIAIGVMIYGLLGPDMSMI